MFFKQKFYKWLAYKIAMVEKPYVRVICYGDNVGNPLSPNNYGVETIIFEEFVKVREGREVRESREVIYPLLMRPEDTSELKLVSKERANELARQWADTLGIEARLK